MTWKLGLYRGLDGLGFPKIRGTLFEGPNNKDYSILGSILGSPYFGKLPLIHNKLPYLCLLERLLCSCFRKGNFNLSPHAKAELL